VVIKRNVTSIWQSTAPATTASVSVQNTNIAEPEYIPAKIFMYKSKHTQMLRQDASARCKIQTKYIFGQQPHDHNAATTPGNQSQRCRIADAGTAAAQNSSKNSKHSGSATAWTLCCNSVKLKVEAL